MPGTCSGHFAFVVRVNLEADSLSSTHKSSSPRKRGSSTPRPRSSIHLRWNTGSSGQADDDSAHLRVQFNFLSRFNLIPPVQPLAQKYFGFPPTQITSLCRAIPSRSEGRLANRHGRWVRDAVDAECADDERRMKRTAKSCGPDAPTLASSSRNRFRGRRWQESPVTGESTYKP
jgi:hypothetical protein